MNRILKSAVLGLAVAATTLATLPAAQAGDGWRRHGGGHHHRYDNRTGDVVAAGVLGLAVGAIVGGIASANSAPVYGPVYGGPVYREPVYREVRPRPRPYRGYYVGEPQVIYAEPVRGSLEPWSRGWYRYCEDRYRSFDPRTGTFTGYDGVKRFCTVN